MSTTRGVIIAFGVLGIGFLAVGGITASKMSGVVRLESSYDMAHDQVSSFVQSIATREGWKPSTPNNLSSLRKPGEKQLDYSAPMLPWMNAHVTVKLWPERSGTHVEVAGNGDQVNVLKTQLDNRLPALGTP